MMWVLVGFVMEIQDCARKEGMKRAPATESSSDEDSSDEEEVLEGSVIHQVVPVPSVMQAKPINHMHQQQMMYDMEMYKARQMYGVHHYLSMSGMYNMMRDPMFPPIQRLCGGDWPDVEGEYRQLVKGNKGKTVEVEKHPCWKQLENALHAREVTDDRDGTNDDELEITQVERNTVCPVSRKEMMKPVKNII